jgi:hypothetical protein
MWIWHTLVGRKNITLASIKPRGCEDDLAAEVGFTRSFRELWVIYPATQCYVLATRPFRLNSSFDSPSIFASKKLTYSKTFDFFAGRLACVAGMA